MTTLTGTEDGARGAEVYFRQKQQFGTSMLLEGAHSTHRRSSQRVTAGAPLGRPRTFQNQRFARSLSMSIRGENARQMNRKFLLGGVRRFHTTLMKRTRQEHRHA